MHGDYLNLVVDEEGRERGKAPDRRGERKTGAPPRSAGRHRSEMKRAALLFECRSLGPIRTRRRTAADR